MGTEDGNKQKDRLNQMPLGTEQSRALTY